jgi:hypothetical protein
MHRPPQLVRVIYAHAIMKDAGYVHVIKNSQLPVCHALEVRLRVCHSVNFVSKQCQTNS